jgi:hypothetical protein
VSIVLPAIICLTPLLEWARWGLGALVVTVLLLGLPMGGYSAEKGKKKKNAKERSKALVASKVRQDEEHNKRCQHRLCRVDLMHHGSAHCSMCLAALPPDPLLPWTGYLQPWEAHLLPSGRQGESNPDSPSNRAFQSPTTEGDRIAAAHNAAARNPNCRTGCAWGHGGSRRATARPSGCSPRGKG